MTLVGLRALALVLDGLPCRLTGCTSPRSAHLVLMANERLAAPVPQR